jgi:Zn-finger protein
MSYTKWFDAHAKKHKEIVDKLVKLDYTKEEIIEYFDFDNMVKKEVDFCPLFKENKRCHDMDKLNCYMCACPNFRFNDDGLGKYNEFKILSKCDINNGKKFAGNGVIHQDCSTCSVPHHKSYILKNFSLDWKEMMKDCKSN